MQFVGSEAFGKGAGSKYVAFFEKNALYCMCEAFEFRQRNSRFLSTFQNSKELRNSNKTQ